MLSRHFLRVKVLQQLYGCIVSSKTDTVIAQKELLESIEQTYELEVYLLSAVLEIRDIEENLIEDAKNKFYPTEEEKNPNLRFVRNSLFAQLSVNKELGSQIEKLKINWSDHKDMLRGILNRFKASNSYKEYMQREKSEYEDEKRVVVQMMKNYMFKNESFLDFLFEKRLGWESDFDYVGLSFLNYLKDFTEQDGESKPLFRMFSDEKTDERREFALDLLAKCLSHYSEYDPMFLKHVENWDVDRVALLDKMIIKMGVSELIYCPTIPVRVSMNEYIELAKEFSTERSKLFVNGLLDKFLVDLRAAGKINKVEFEKENEEEEE